MSAIRPYQDIETRRQSRNQTSTQKKNISEMKEGLIVNTLIKEPMNLDNMYDSLVIPDKTETKPSQSVSVTSENKKGNLTPLLLTTLGLFGALAGGMALIARAAKHRTKLPAWQTLPEVPKNTSINSEPHIATYLMIQDPNTKTVLGALGVFVLSAIGLVGKNFIDGVKAVWVRKKEADVQRDLQEKLIAVETKSFSGKMLILRNMLSEKAHELDDVLKKNNITLFESLTFKKFINFGKNNKSVDSDKKNNNTNIVAAVLGTTLAIGGLSFLAFRSVQKTAKFYKDYEAGMMRQIKNLVKNSDVKEEDLEFIKRLLTSLRAGKKDIEETFAQIKKPVYDYSHKPINLEEYTQRVMKDIESLSQKPAQEIAGTPGNKPMYYSHTNDDRAHLYNMIVNWENPLLKILFAGMASVTTVGYAGTKIVEAIKDVEVIKENAQTELDLQQRLVSVELKNFETKKRSVIEPLIHEFKQQASAGKNKKELKVRAENILYEIKNGPPFVYS